MPPKGSFFAGNATASFITCNEIISWKLKMQVSYVAFCAMAGSSTVSQIALSSSRARLQGLQCKPPSPILTSKLAQPLPMARALDLRKLLRYRGAAIPTPKTLTTPTAPLTLPSWQGWHVVSGSEGSLRCGQHRRRARMEDVRLVASWRWVQL